MATLANFLLAKFLGWAQACFGMGTDYPAFPNSTLMDLDITYLGFWYLNYWLPTIEMKMLILGIIFTIFAQGEAGIYDTLTNWLDGGSTSTVVQPGQLSVKYFTQAVNAGNVISPYDAVFPPYITYEAGPDALYTLAAVDPDTPSYSSSFDKEYIHILIVNIPGSNISAGDSIVRYIAPNPQPGSGYHRFMFLLYKQEDRIDVKTNYFVKLARKLTNFSIAAFAKEYNLGNPVAANFFRSQHIICEEADRQQQCS